MTSKDKILSQLNGIRSSIRDNNFNRSNISGLLKEAESEISSLITINPGTDNSLIKNLIVTFNIKNFSDFTMLFVIKSGQMQIIESAGSDFILDEFNLLHKTDIEFYKNTESLKIKGNSYRIFYESMEIEKGVYTILTITESVFFKPSKFHMLSDIIMDIVRSTAVSRVSMYNDLFEDTVIGINSYLSTTDVVDSEFYLFKFENIYDFFLKMGLEIIIELSEAIKIKLTEVFGENASIFRFSLSEYIVIAPSVTSQQIRFSDLNNRNVIDFSYKGVVLQHRCIKIPHENKSIYDIFETIFIINNPV
ncbi:MAG: hypothetical protein CVV49_06495 [Spirochaetae bacterium HGW-Spirochaetae-5]|nr:MAG: hypothetical protein CVV49_06495 [Spirochaetae bacterium HGW-Spirochaetae-5]